MGIIIGNFASGWQNKARPELMKEDALVRCIDLSLEELGSLTCRLKHREEQGYFKQQTLTTEIKNLFQVDVEGLGHRLVFYSLDDVLYVWDSYTRETRTVSYSMVGQRISYAPILPVLSTTTYVFITDGYSMLADNGVLTKTWGLDKPTSLPLVSMAGSGGLLSAGDYQYRYTFYDSNTGAESDPSIASAATTAVANDEATVSDIETSPNDRVTKRRIYRTLVGGGVYYLCGQINDNVSTTYIDSVGDTALTSELNTDQGVPPRGDVVVTYKERLFLCGDTDYPNKVYFSRSNRPDNWPSTNYLEVGTSDDMVMNMVEFEGKLYFVQTATISGLYGSDENTYAWHKTRSHVGTRARWSVAVGPDGIYFLGHEGVYRFDGLKSVLVSEAIGKTFGKITSEWVDIIDEDTVEDAAEGWFLADVYWLSVPLKDTDGTVTQRLLAFDTVDQTWLRFDVDCGCLFADGGRGVIYGSMEKPDDAGKYSVYELMNAVAGTDTASPVAVTKSYGIVQQEQGTKSRAVGWLRRFRVDCLGSWDVEVYVDGSSVHTESLTDQSASTRYTWYDFAGKIKGRYVYVKLTATGSPQADTCVFNELEIE